MGSPSPIKFNYRLMPWGGQVWKKVSAKADPPMAENLKKVKSYLKNVDNCMSEKTKGEKNAS